jgi:molybdopterin converting factor small subunit
MPTLRIPTPLRNYTNGQSEIDVRGQTVAEAMSYLVREYPGLQPHLFNEEGSLRPFVNIFLGEENVKDLQGSNTPLQENDRLLLVPSIAGGTLSSDSRH